MKRNFQKKTDCQNQFFFFSAGNFCLCQKGQKDKERNGQAAGSKKKKKATKLLRVGDVPFI